MARKHLLGTEVPIMYPKKMKRFMKALRNGELRLAADTESGNVLVPLELIRGPWVLVKGREGGNPRAEEARNYLCAVTTDGEEIEPRYYSPTITHRPN